MDANILTVKGQVEIENNGYSIVWNFFFILEIMK